MAVKKEIIEQLADFTKEKHQSNESFNIGSGIISIRKNIKDICRSQKPFVINSLIYQVSKAKQFKNIPLRLELNKDPAAKNKFQLMCSNLITDEVIRIYSKWLGRNIIEPDDCYEVWMIWINNPNDDTFQDDYYLPVIVPPLDLEQTEKQIDLSKDKEVELNF